MQSNKNQNIGRENWLSTSLPPPLTALCLHGLLYQWYSSSLVPKKILERNTAKFARAKGLVHGYKSWTGMRSRDSIFGVTLCHKRPQCRCLHNG